MAFTRPSWDSPAADELWTELLRQGSLARIARIRGRADSARGRFRHLAMSRHGRAQLAGRVRARAAVGATCRFRRQCRGVQRAKHLFNPDALTLGFARRFATYKRPNLLLRDPERLARLLTNPQRPVQLILAGKAHPADVAGQALIRDWVQFVRRARCTAACDLLERLRHAADRAAGRGSRSYGSTRRGGHGKRAGPAA